MEIAGATHNRIGPGYAILLGVGEGDTDKDAESLADKTANLRIFSNSDGKFDHSLLDIKGEALVISQFTLYGDASKGRRPDFTKAARPPEANRLYEYFVSCLTARGINVKTGIFAADMTVEIINDGPVTIMLDTRDAQMKQTDAGVIAELIRVYKLKPHPEGGYFRESYRSAGTIPAAALGGNLSGERNCSTAIYFLLPEGSKSKLHRIKSDETWHFYMGGPLTLAQIFPDGRVENVTLGQDIKAGQKFQHVVPAGCWFGAYPEPGSGFSFAGCTVAPGFDFADFELAVPETLLALFPHAANIIKKLTI